MSNINPENNLDSKDPDPSTSLSSAINPKNQQENEKSEDQLILPKEGFCPPKLDSDAFISNNQINSGEPAQQNSESHAEKFNGPLEKPKTANKAFGGITDFLLFFENRNHEIKDFAKKFKEMENSDPILSLKILNEEIVPTVYKSFKSMPIEFKNHNSSSKLVNENQESEQSKQNLKMALSKFFQKKKTQKEQKIRDEYAQLFEKDFKNIEEFLKQVLHAYTIPGFLYLRMNEYLRTEDWIKLDDLLVYTYSLFKAYLWGPTGLIDANSFTFLQSKAENGKLTLYRRADFDQVSLDFYQLDKIKEFSWSGVTSTSLIESATRSFAGKKPNKQPVLIVIEVDFKDLQPENFNALYLAKISRCPGEEEVALAPGSIFELLDINKGKPEAEMRLRLITNAKILAQQGKFLHGMLQAIMRNESELKIVCLEGKDLSRAIKHCQGNQLIRDIEISLCNVNGSSARVLLDVLPTIKHLASFTFNSVEFEGECNLDQIMECLGNMKIKKLEILDSLSKNNDANNFAKSFKYLGSLDILKLSFKNSYEINVGKLLQLRIQYLDPKCIFELTIANDREILAKGLEINTSSKDSENFRVQENTLDLIGTKELVEFRFGKDYQTSKRGLLEALQDKYTFNRDEKNGEKSPETENEESKDISSTEKQPGGVKYMGFSKYRKKYMRMSMYYPLYYPIYFFRHFENPIYLTPLKQPLEALYLSFEGCQNITDQDLKSLGCEGIQNIQSLKTLNLNFNGCNRVTNRTLEILGKDLLQKLKGLNSLNLSFEDCKCVTARGFQELVCHGIQHLQLLTSLSLNFSKCSGKFCQELMSLEGITGIRSLTALHINFKFCLSDAGMEYLCSDGGIQNLESLESLSLSFADPYSITNKGLEILSKTVLPKLKKCVKNLSLSFDACEKVTDEGLRILNFEGILNFESLTTLSLSFSGFDLKITDEGLMDLCSQGATHMSSLTTLRLSFDGCRRITDAGLSSIHFPQKLNTLHLSFNLCNKLSDSAIQSLARKIKDLQSLESLYLSFGNCPNISDDGVMFLCSKGIRYLKKLTTLHLRFGIVPNLSKPGECCFEITDKCLASIGFDGIRHLPGLRALSLDFDGCEFMTQNGFQSLCRNGIRYLEKLTDLHLSFQTCFSLEDQGLDTICTEGISRLKNSLKTLYLGFSKCYFSDNKIRDFYKSLQRLQHSVTLNLNLSFSNFMSKDVLFWFQSQMNSLDLPQLQLSLSFWYDFFDLRVKTPLCQFLNGPNAASAFCQDRIIFTSQLTSNLGEHIEFEKLENQKKSIENFALKFNQGPNNITDLDISRNIFSSDKIKSLNNMKILDLSFDKCRSITDLTLQNLCFEGLKHLELLTTLHLSFHGCQEISHTGLKILGSGGLNYLKSLVNLSLSFNDCQGLKDESLEILRQSYRTELLKTLSLSFSGCLFIGDSGLRELGLQRFKSLTSLALNFDRCPEITNQGIQELSVNDIKHLKLLKSLNLSFQFCPNITERGIEAFCFEDKDLLTSFSINLTGIKISENLKKQLFNSSSSSAFVICANNVQNQIETPQLRRQNVNKQRDFDKVKPTDEEAVEISVNQILTRYLGRNRYWLNFSDLTWYDYGTHDVFCNKWSPETIFVNNYLPKMNIQSLFVFPSITELDEKVHKYISKLSDQEAKYFQSLTSLRLILGKWESSITDSVLNILNLKVFQNLKSLTTLYLSFDGCSKITSEGLKNLGSEGIQHLKSLTSLKISFNSSSQTDDIVLKNLCSEGIQHLKSLTALDLSFESCNNITGKGLRSLYDGIKNLGLLTNLRLCFPNCPEISLSQLASLRNQINSLPLPQLQRPLEVNDHAILSGSTKSFPEPVDPSHKVNDADEIDFSSFDAPAKDDFSVQPQVSSNVEKTKIEECKILKLKNNSHDDLRICRNCYYFPDEGDNLNKLENLYVGLMSVDDITSLKIKSLWSSLIKDSKTLKTLHISLAKYEELNDDDLKTLAENGIQHLSELETLVISLDDCVKITPQGFETLCRTGIQGLKKLVELRLNFNGCKAITDKELVSLWDAIQQLGMLRILHLSFDRCDKLTDEGLNRITLKGILNMPFIENLKPSFLGCPRISSKSYQAFLDMLKYFGCLPVDKSPKGEDSKSSEGSKDGVNP